MGKMRWKKSRKGMYPYTVTVITGNGETARVSGRMIFCERCTILRKKNSFIFVNSLKIMILMKKKELL